MSDDTSPPLDSINHLLYIFDQAMPYSWAFSASSQAVSSTSLLAWVDSAVYLITAKREPKSPSGDEETVKESR
jgi:hypothetical protein